MLGAARPGRLGQALAGALGATAVYALLLFVPAGTVGWFHAWVLLAIVAVAMALNRAALDDGLLAQRRSSPFAPGQPAADKLLVVAFLIATPAYIAAIPLDVFRFHVFAEPPLPWRLAGLALFAAGIAIVALAVRTNRFAIGIVRVQTERAHTLVDHGVYGIIRHPMYAGLLIALVGASLWLGSLAVLAATLVPLALIVVRIVVEERLLMQRLPRYAAYARRVRKRLIPFVW